MSEQISTHCQVVERVINREEFDAAWREIGESGIGSAFTAEKMGDLIFASEWHMEKLTEHGAELLKDAGTWADGTFTNESTLDFHAQIVHKLLIVAAAYAVMGVMVGVLSVCPDEEDS